MGNLADTRYDPPSEEHAPIGRKGMPVETPSLFALAIREHLELKERNAQLDREMPIDRYRNDDPFENHPLFKTEEQARIEETMDGVEPDFSDASLENVLAWPTSEEESAVESAAPSVPEESGFWASAGARDFDWGD
jgi:hypothetical protein